MKRADQLNSHQLVLTGQMCLLSRRASRGIFVACSHGETNRNHEGQCRDNADEFI
jgi:hypothetical protein